MLDSNGRQLWDEDDWPQQPIKGMPPRKTKYTLRWEMLAAVLFGIGVWAALIVWLS